MDGVMKECCGLCPYSRNGTLFLHPDRAEEFAYQATNPYNDFVCHKTGVIDESDEDCGSEIVRGEKSLTCMGFASLQQSLNENSGEMPLDEDAFEDCDEMIDFHTEEWDSKNKSK